MNSVDMNRAIGKSSTQPWSQHVFSQEMAPLSPAVQTVVVQTPQLPAQQLPLGADRKGSEKINCSVSNQKETWLTEGRCPLVCSWGGDETGEIRDIHDIHYGTFLAHPMASVMHERIPCVFNSLTNQFEKDNFYDNLYFFDTFLVPLWFEGFTLANVDSHLGDEFEKRRRKFLNFVRSLEPVLLTFSAEDRIGIKAHFAKKMKKANGEINKLINQRNQRIQELAKILKDCAAIGQLASTKPEYILDRARLEPLGDIVLLDEKRTPLHVMLKFCANDERLSDEWADRVLNFWLFDLSEKKYLKDLNKWKEKALERAEDLAELENIGELVQVMRANRAQRKQKEADHLAEVPAAPQNLLRQNFPGSAVARPHPAPGCVIL